MKLLFSIHINTFCKFWPFTCIWLYNFSEIILIEKSQVLNTWYTEIYFHAKIGLKMFFSWNPANTSITHRIDAYNICLKYTDSTYFLFPTGRAGRAFDF